MILLKDIIPIVLQNGTCFPLEAIIQVSHLSLILQIENCLIAKSEDGSESLYNSNIMSVDFSVIRIARAIILSWGYAQL